MTISIVRTHNWRGETVYILRENGRRVDYRQFHRLTEAQAAARNENTPRRPNAQPLDRKNGTIRETAEPVSTTRKHPPNRTAVEWIKGRPSAWFVRLGARIIRGPFMSQSEAEVAAANVERNRRQRRNPQPRDRLGRFTKQGRRR